MVRKNICEIIKSSPIDIGKDYKRIYELFYNEKLIPNGYNKISISELAHNHFRKFSQVFVGRAISFADFNETYGYTFHCSDAISKAISIADNDGLSLFVKFAEYIYNVTHQLLFITLTQQLNVHILEAKRVFEYLLNFIKNSISEIGYSVASHDGIYIFIETNPAAISVAEITDNKLSFKVIEYNHYKLKGDLTAKLSILKLVADDIEPQRKILNNINKTLADNLFQMLQKFVRHNNEDNPYIKGLSSNELEVCYDDIYQMWLLAKLEIDNLERKKRVEAILKKINDK